jgi:hypothetical protein
VGWWGLGGQGEHGFAALLLNSWFSSRGLVTMVTKTTACLTDMFALAAPAAAVAADVVGCTKYTT